MLHFSSSTSEIYDFDEFAFSLFDSVVFGSSPKHILLSLLSLSPLSLPLSLYSLSSSSFFLSLSMSAHLFLADGVGNSTYRSTCWYGVSEITFSPSFVAVHLSLSRSQRKESFRFVLKIFFKN